MSGTVAQSGQPQGLRLVGHGRGESGAWRGASQSPWGGGGSTAKLVGGLADRLAAACPDTRRLGDALTPGAPGWQCGANDC